MKSLRIALLGALLAVVAGNALAGMGAIGRAVGGIRAGSAGFLPVGHFIDSPIQGLTQVFPQPDASTASYAREHWAYWDGTNDIPYDLTMGVSFGAYPYVFKLLSGPPGMTIEQTTYSGFQNKAYGRVLWHPQGNISAAWTGTVSVQVTDQEHNSITISWTLSTSSATTHFVFVSTTGTGSTCTYSAPCTFATAFGTTSTASTFPGAICYVFGGSYSGSTDLPVFTDTSNFKVNGTLKPDALIGIPGQTVTLDASAVQTLIATGGANGDDWYMENITANGYDSATGAIDRLIDLTSNRLTFDQVSWTNSGWGPGTTPPSSNMSMFTSGGGTDGTNLFITDSLETNRQTGASGNNFGFLDIYSYTDSLVQRSTEDSPSSSLSSVFFYKSDVTHSELREDYANVAGSTTGFGYGQAQYSGMGDDESDYNLGVNVAQIWFGNAGNGNYTYGNFALLRNTILAGSGQAIRGPTTYNLEGPGGPGTINASSTTGGSLTAGTQYTCGATSLGVTGESSDTIGSNGVARTGVVAGDGNSTTLTLATGDDAIALSWVAEPGATGYNVYCEVAGSGTWTEYSVGTATSFTYTGTGGTSATPPAAPGDAISAARFTFDGNALSTTYTPAPPPTGGTVNTPTGNVVDATSGTIICLATGSGCAAVGDLNSAYSGYSSLIGTAGYQIQ